MSLVVWLPLNGDLTNLGLSNITMINSSATVSTAGKTGWCYQFAANGYLYENTYDWSNFNTTEFSICCWYKEPSPVASGNSQMVCIGTANGWNNIRIGLLRRTSNGYPMFSVSDGSSAVQYNFTADSFTLDVWNHIAVTYKSGALKMYLNGTLHKSGTTTIVPALNSSQHLGVGAASGGNEKLTGFLNDVRIYDHALSPMEVHEIAQAKLIHLKLSDPYVEATTNLATANLSNTCYNGATNKYSYGTNTDMYKDDGYYQGRTCTRVRMGTNGLDAYPYVYFDAFNATGTTIQTLSFDYFPTIQTVLVPYSYNGTYNWFWSNGETSGTTLNSATCASIPVKLYQWNHITVTAGKYDTTSTARGIGYIRIGSAKHTSNIMNYWLFANVQVEAKDHETGWTALDTTRDAETLVDSSGYLHNAIPNALTTSSDTPMYSLSTVFNGSSGYAKVNDTIWMADGMTDFTVSIWMKASSWPTQIRPYCCLETGGFGLGNAGSSGYYRFYVHEYQNADHTTTGYDSNTTALKISALSTTNWNHVVIVHTNSYTKTYVNGTLHKTYTRTCYGVHFNTAARLFIGCEAGGASATTPYFNGQLSDFRFYASALSDDDIMRLYKSRGFVDDIGNVYIGEAKEL